MPGCEYSNCYRRGSREFAQISLARPWDAHGEVATSGNAGGLHIFAEAGLKRIGVPTRTIQQVLHPKRRSFPGPPPPPTNCSSARNRSATLPDNSDCALVPPNAQIHQRTTVRLKVEENQ